MKALIFKIGWILHYLAPMKDAIEKTRRVLYTGYCSAKLKSIGKDSIIEPYLLALTGGKYISIGDDTRIDRGTQLSAYSHFGDQDFTPEIRIGNGCGIGANSHLSAVNGIFIGNNVRMGKEILITDNAHGASRRELLDQSPRLRPLYSKGPVIIEDNVWIGEKASIMPGVKIGKGSIIAANSVVTHEVSPYCVVGGNPAKVIKQL